LTAAKEIKAFGGKLVIAATQPQVEYSITVSGIDTQIPLFSSVEKALSG